MSPKKSKPRLTAAELLASKPVRLVDVDLIENESGSRIKVPLKSRGLASWLLRMPADATKTFEFDQLGTWVWKQCDGKTSLQHIIRRLAKRYNLSLREAEVSTKSFLQMLVKKQLVGMQLKDSK